ncbi:MAG: hypothetical protein KGI37_09930 [Alphaproteobacteria bacterium]|nr:hypothetical protein [Alphaproteobacteria bacterium]
MPIKCTLGTAVLALLICLCLPVAHAAAATPATTYVVSDPSCTNYDDTVNNNRSAWQTNLYNVVNNVDKQFPMAAGSSSACIQTTMQAFQTLSSLINSAETMSDPLNIVEGIAKSAIDQVVSSVVMSACSAVAQTVTQSTGSLQGLLTICVPLPSFDLGLQGPNFSYNCTGSGTPYGLVGTSNLNPAYTSTPFDASQFVSP